MDHHKIVKKLIGPINPVGSSHIDKEHFDNLTALVSLTALLMDDIYEVSKFEDRQEFSMRNAGLFAKGALEGLKRP